MGRKADRLLSGRRAAIADIGQLSAFPKTIEFWKWPGWEVETKRQKPPETNMTGIVYALPRSSSGRGRSVLATLWGRAVVHPSVAKRIGAITPSRSTVLCAL